MMMDHEQIILIVCADSSLSRRYFSELEQSGPDYRLLLAGSAAEAHRAFRRVSPAVILLDAAVGGDASDASLESTVSMLLEGAPVVVVAPPQQQCSLAYLIASGAVDFAAREGSFVSTAAALVERRIHIIAARLATRAEAAAKCRPTEEFGEILRHEVNNPLTGILGNAELLLARREPLPPTAIARVETIAALAVRLRETVRRLSLACGSASAAESGVQSGSEHRSRQTRQTPQAQQALQTGVQRRLRPRRLVVARPRGSAPMSVPSPLAVQEPVEE